MREVILIVTKMILLIAAVICFIKPVQVVKTLFGISRLMVDKLGMADFVDAKTKNVAQLSVDKFESFGDEFPWHVRIIRLSGIIFLIMFILSLCMTPPPK